MINKFFIAIFLVSSMYAMQNSNVRLNGNFVSEDDVEIMEPVQCIDGEYNVSLNEQLAARFTLRDGKHAWLYIQMLMLPTKNAHVGLASRGLPNDNYHNFAIDFKKTAVRKFKDKTASK